MTHACENITLANTSFRPVIISLFYFRLVSMGLKADRLASPFRHEYFPVLTWDPRRSHLI